MHTILHRINTTALLEKTPSNFGVEIDIRSNGKSLILHHDPFEQGELFEDWIRSYHHGTLILNVKEEGLESSVLKLMNQYKINDFFFLDQSFPFLWKTAVMGESGEDIKMARAAREKFPFSIECKNVEKLNVWEAY